MLLLELLVLRLSAVLGLESVGLRALRDRGKKERSSMLNGLEKLGAVMLTISKSAVRITEMRCKSLFDRSMIEDMMT